MRSKYDYVIHHGISANNVPNPIDMKLSPVRLVLLLIVQPYLLLLSVPKIIRLQLWTGLLQHPRTVTPFPAVV